MKAVVLTSGNTLDSSLAPLDFYVYKGRVLADGGIINNEAEVKEAFNFILQNGITESQAFSITSAKWGIKLNGDKPSKLYSLFGASGDVNITIGVPNSIFYNTTTHGFPVIELKAASTNGLLSGLVSGVENAGICVVAKAPLLATGASYGTGNSFALGSLGDLSNSASAAVTVDKRLLSLFFKRNASTDVATAWTYLTYGYGTQGSIDTTAIISDMTKWSHAASFIDTSGMYLYNNGNLAASDLTVIQKPYKDNLNFNIGRERDPQQAALGYASSLYAYVAESWCLVNTTKEVMQAISLRASTKYTT